MEPQRVAYWWVKGRWEIYFRQIPWGGYKLIGILTNIVRIISWISWCEKVFHTQGQSVWIEGFFFIVVVYKTLVTKSNLWLSWKNIFFPVCREIFTCNEHPKISCNYQPQKSIGDLTAKIAQYLCVGWNLIQSVHYIQRWHGQILEDTFLMFISV